MKKNKSKGHVPGQKWPKEIENILAPIRQRLEAIREAKQKENNNE